MKKNITAILFGLIAILSGILVIGNTMHLWREISFRGWWTVFIIVPGIGWMISYGVKAWNVTITLVGLLLLSNQQGWLGHINPAYIWAFVLIAFGIYIIYKSLNLNTKQKSPKIYVEKKQENSDDFISIASVFAKVDSYNDSLEFKGGNITSVFGGVTLDLRNAKIVDGAVIEITGVFGGAKVLLPSNCIVNVSGMPILGGMDNHFKSSSDENAPKLIVKYTAIFSGIELK